MVPVHESAVHQVYLRALKASLELKDARDRTESVLSALSWDRPEALVEWAPFSNHIGRFTVGNFPTSASIVVAKNPARLAWHSGFRWCVSVDRGALEWFDFKEGLHWRGTSDVLTARTLAGLTPQSFADNGRLQPRDVRFDRTGLELSTDPSQRVAERIKEWWELSCQHHLSEKDTPEGKGEHQDRFIRFMAGVLLLRTVEDLQHVEWLPKGSLLETMGVRAPSQAFSDLVGTVARRLNNKTINRLARDLHIEVKKAIISGTYELGIDFAALDVDPVGAFYEEILGVAYDHAPKPQFSLFKGDDLIISEDRTARRIDGVYYTPRIYADTLARKLVRPAVRTAENTEELPVIADIAAGSGELLCAALREILAEPMWHTPQVAWTVLSEKLIAVDRNPLALQLCTLNLLRTAIRYVPELLDMEQGLPRIEKNLSAGDALTKRVIDAIFTPDIVLMNPPFSGPNRWSRPDPETAIPELYEVESHPNRAIAFFAAAVRLVRPGGRLGVILPSSVFEGPSSDLWRRWLADQVSLDLVVSNYGTPFRNHSRAGFVIGQKRAAETQWRPRTRVVRIGADVDPALDTGALLSDVGLDPCISKQLVPAIDESSPNWIGVKRPLIGVVAKHRRRPLCEVMGDQFHQGVVLAPKPWKTELFLFNRLSNGKLLHVASNQVVGQIQSPLLRGFINAKKMTKRIPLWCEPAVENAQVFMPPGVDVWASIEPLRRTDPGGWKLGRLICKYILEYEPKQKFLSRDAAAFVLHAKKNELRFSILKGFRDVSLPLVYASSASVTARSRGKRRAWYSWVSLGGKVVPVSGLQMRAPREEFAAALVAWMSIDELVAPLVSLAAAPRIGGAVKFNLETVAQWPVPDIREDRLQARLDELCAAFTSYRERVDGLSPEQALRHPNYGEVQEIALTLWKEA